MEYVKLKGLKKGISGICKVEGRLWWKHMCVGALFSQGRH